jgi:hypothetical protein
MADLIVSKDSFKPTDFLSEVNKFFKAKLGSQVVTIEEMFQSHMDAFVEASGKETDIEHIEFHMELKEFEFIFYPHNFFTYLLSEGIYIAPEELGENFVYRTKDGIYKFEKEKLKGFFIPQRLLGGTH